MIGRRAVTYQQFVDAVKKSKRYTEVCDNLGLNHTVATTKQVIKDRIAELQLDTSHFEYKYTKSDNYDKAMEFRRKVFNIHPINQAYYEAMEQKFADKPQSFSTYKVDCGGILEQLEDRDFATITIKDIEDYAGRKESAVLHIRSMMIQTVKENINGAIDKVSKDMLVWLI